MPAETDNGTVKYVQIGDKLKIRRAWNDGNLDTFWGFKDEDCTPELKVRAILNLGDDTIEFVDGNAGVDTVISDEERSIVAVYNLAGVKVDGNNLDKGIYIVSYSDGTSEKVIK